MELEYVEGMGYCEMRDGKIFRVIGNPSTERGKRIVAAAAGIITAKYHVDKEFIAYIGATRCRKDGKPALLHQFNIEDHLNPKYKSTVGVFQKGGIDE